MRIPFFGVFSAFAGFLRTGFLRDGFRELFKNRRRRFSVFNGFRFFGRFAAAGAKGSGKKVRSAFFGMFVFPAPIDNLPPDFKLELV